MYIGHTYVMYNTHLAVYFPIIHAAVFVERVLRTENVGTGDGCGTRSGTGCRACRRIESAAACDVNKSDTFSRKFRGKSTGAVRRTSPRGPTNRRRKRDVRRRRRACARRTRPRTKIVFAEEK